MNIELKTLLKTLKELCRNAENADGDKRKQVENKISQTIFKIAKLYKTKYQSEVHKKKEQFVSLLRCVGLMNAAILRQSEDDDKIIAELAQLCKNVLLDANAANCKADLLKIARDIKLDLKELRANVNKELRLNLSSDDNIDKKIKQIETLQNSITEDYIKMMKKISDHCSNIMGVPPCKFVLLGMGSLSRKEITPYSDFEHFILYKNPNVPVRYFRWFSLIFHIIVLNLQETILPCLHIEGMFTKNITTNKLECWFKDDKTRGVCFDGMDPHARKFPLSWPNELILSIDDLSCIMRNKSGIEDKHHLRDMLSKPIFVSGDYDLYDFVKKFLEITEMTVSSGINRTRVEREVKKDLDKFSARVSLSQLFASRELNIKKLIYRSLSLFIFALSRLHKIQATSSFEAVDKLAEKGVVSELTQKNLKLAVALSCEIRLSWYMKNKAQWDRVEEDEQKIEKFLEIIGESNTVSLFQIIYCLQAELAKQLKLKKLHFFSHPRMINVTIFYALKQNKKLNHLLKTNNDQQENVSVENFDFDLVISFLQAETKDADDGPMTQFNSIDVTIVAKKIEELAQSCQVLSHHDEEEEFLEKALNLYERDSNTDLISVTRIKRKLASCKIDQNNFQEAKEILYELLHQKQNLIEKCKDEVGLLYKYLGLCEMELNNYEVALGLFEKSLQVFTELSNNDKDIADVHNNLALVYMETPSQADEALKHLFTAETLYQKELLMKKEVTSKDLADVYSNIGLSYNEKGDHEAALRYYFRCLRIYLCKDLLEPEDLLQEITKDSNKDVADVCLNIGISLCKQIHPERALKYFFKSYEIYENMPLDNDKDLADAMNNIGKIYQNMARLPKALPLHLPKSLSFLFRSLHIYIRISEDVDKDRDIAETLANIGSCREMNGKSEEAIQFLSDSIRIFTSLPRNEANDKCIAFVFNILGTCLSRLKEYKLSLYFLYTSATIYSNLSRDEEVMKNFLPQIGECLIRLGI